MANRYYNQFQYGFHKMPVLLDCNFVVDSTNGNGLGIRNLKGPGILAVYMHTSATPAPGNPNPASGLILVQLQDSYYRYYWGTAGFVSPLSGTPISISTGSSLTVGNVYVIVSIGTTTTAQWQAVGVPVGIVPAVGVSFIATATSGAGTGVVETSVSSGIDHIELVGDPNTTLFSTNFGVATGVQAPYIISQCLFEGTRTAPTNGTVIGLTMQLSNSSVVVQGE